ncbi:MAG: zinc-binding dehydrogenase [Rhizobiaceae bacterium]|nr:zinc-binding dehydrogenase [Rhizobiaceae bacterium]
MPQTMQRIVLAARPQGAPKATDFRLESIDMPEPGPGEFLVKTLWLSLDPYMRGRMDDSKSYAASIAIDAPMEGGCVGEVIASNHPKFAVGDFVEDRLGWQSHAISKGQGVRKLDPSIAPLSTAVGVLGMPGITAYVGLNTHGRPKSGETLVVGAATGAVGSLVGQLAKAQGLRVVGVAGGAEKCTYAVEQLGFDACLDHRAAEDASALRSQLAQACPDGVDIYFENVGGKTLEAVLPLMNVHGRIPVCGMIGWYNAGALGGSISSGPNIMPKVWRTILVNRLSVQGFIITDHYDQFPNFLKEVSALIAQGKVVYRESIAEGLESAPQAFMKLLEGGNFGKQLVAVSPDPTR